LKTELLNIVYDFPDEMVSTDFFENRQIGRKCNGMSLNLEDKIDMKTESHNIFNKNSHFDLSLILQFDKNYQFDKSVILLIDKSLSDFQFN
jgi:hypothetical protein